MDVLLCCDQGRECVIHIRELMLMIMRALRNLKPNDTRKKESLQESLVNIKKEFQYLRIFYDICQAKAPEFADLESLIPFAEKMPTKEPTGEEYAEACKERDALKEEVALRNRELEEIITHMRATIYRINCELARAGVIDKENTDEEKTNEAKTNEEKTNEEKKDEEQA